MFLPPVELENTLPYPLEAVIWDIEAGSRHVLFLAPGTRSSTAPCIPSLPPAPSPLPLHHLRVYVGGTVAGFSLTWPCSHMRV